MARVKPYWPALASFLVGVGYVILRLAVVGWDPFLVAEPGEQYLARPVLAEEGYDGQFALYIALEPSPEEVAGNLDVPAFRYQRILLPLLGRILGLGKSRWIPWALILINLSAHTTASFLLCSHLKEKQVWTGYALSYGLWVGLVAGVGLDLYEPLAFALIVGAYFAWKRDHFGVSAVLVSLSLFAKETSLPFWIGFTGSAILHKNARKVILPFLAGGLVYALWQCWQFRTFGMIGLGSGGEGATSFEWIPFNGLWRIGLIDFRVLLLYLLIFGPSILLPTIWALIVSARAILSEQARLETCLLFLSAGLIVFLPFSTFREPLALVRLASGLVFTTLLFAVEFQKAKVLRYGLFWIFFLVLLRPG